ncbi:MAG: serine hydrolase domain-containing protein [Planctomycetota bacterium]
MRLDGWLLRVPSVLTLAFALAAITPARAAEDRDVHVVKSPQAKRIAEFLDHCESTGFTGAVLAARGGEVVIARGVGCADLEGKVPNTARTLFEIASATKQFTGAAILKLVEAKKLKLDDSIAMHLPNIPDDCKKITVRHLLQHTSGIPGTNAEGSGDDLVALIPGFLRGGPRHEPGTHWEYWNQGYSLLAGIIERASGKRYGEFCKEQLFAPSGMGVTMFTGDSAPGKLTVSTGRSMHGAPRRALEHPYGNFGYQYRGMGGAVTNVWDLWRWDRALRGEKVLGKAAKEEYFKPGLNSYALGWEVKQTQGGRQAIEHGGSVRGFLCNVRRLPNDDGCVFVLCNGDDIFPHLITDSLEALLFGGALPIKEPPAVLKPEQLNALVGKYATKSGEPLVIVAQGRAARVTIGKPASPQSGVPDKNGGRAGSIGVAENGDLVFYEWRKITAIKLTRAAKGPVRGITIHDQEFIRQGP